VLKRGELGVTAAFDPERLGMVLVPGVALAPPGRVIPGAEVTVRGRLGAELPRGDTGGEGAAPGLTELSLALSVDHGRMRYQVGMESRGAPAWPRRESREEPLGEAWRLGVGIDLEL